MTAPARGPRLGQLLELAWPVIVSRSSQVVVGFCDAAMVAGLGEPALAATTTGALNTFAMFILPMGVVFIVQSFASQLFGKGDLAGARRYGWYGLVVAAAAQVLCTAAALYAPRAVGSLGYADDVRALLASYLVVRLLSGGAAIGIEALANYYGGLGNTRLPMVASLVAMALNVLGNYALIGGHLGAPALGVTGAALASALSTVIAFALLFACFLRRIGVPAPDPAVPELAAAGVSEEALAGAAPSAAATVSPAEPPRLSLRELGRMLRFGLPSGLNWFFELAAFAFFVNVVVTGLGTATLAAFMAVMQLNSIAFMPSFGVASSGAILVGQAIGRREHHVVPATVRLTLLVTGGWQGMVGLLYLAIPTLLIRPFASEGAATSGFLEIAARILMLSAAWQIVDAAANTLSEALRATGDTAFTLWARMALAWLVFVPGSLVTVRHFGGGDLGAVLWMVVYIGLLALILGLRFRGGAWRRLDLTGNGDDATLA